jgi:general stress protein 26
MPSRTELIKKINDMIGDIDVAMFTTKNDQNELHSRPMTTQKREFDGDLWFFADRTSDLVSELQRYSAVNVSYVVDGNYVSIAGQAKIVSDVRKKKELWHPALDGWFEKGPESLDVVLIRVEATSAQYWETPSGMIGKVLAMAKVILTGDDAAAGDSEAVSL